jgi:type I restriction enzyme S subunit
MITTTDWKQTRLGNEVELLYGKGLPASARITGEIPVYGSNGIVGFHNKSLVEGPGIIVGRKGSVGEIAFSDGPFWPIDTTYYVSNRGSNDWRFLYFLLRHLQLTELNSHSTIPGLNRESVYSIEWTFPQRAEQEKIAAVLWKIQKALEIEEASVRSERDLKKSLLRRLFTHGLSGDPLKETEIGMLPQSWEVQRISDVAKISSGGTPDRAISRYWQNGTIPWVKTGEINYCIINDTGEKITEAGLRNSAARMYPQGTLLIAMYGQGITRGRVAILGIEAAINQACGAFLLNDEIVTEYLYHYLTFAYERLRSLAHGANQQNLNARLVSQLQFPKPSKQEQRDIANALQTVDRKIDTHESKKHSLQELFKTMLHKLMTAQIRVNDLDIDTTEVTA